MKTRKFFDYLLLAAFSFTLILSGLNFGTSHLFEGIMCLVWAILMALCILAIEKVKREKLELHEAWSDLKDDRKKLIEDYNEVATLAKAIKEHCGNCSRTDCPNHPGKFEETSAPNVEHPVEQPAEQPAEQPLQPAVSSEESPEVESHNPLDTFAPKSSAEAHDEEPLGPQVETGKDD